MPLDDPKSHVFVLADLLNTLLECGLDPNATDERGEPVVTHDLARKMSRRSGCALVSAGLDLRRLAPSEDLKAVFGIFSFTNTLEENRRIAHRHGFDCLKSKKLL